jgi:hypothetical protein
MNQTRVQAFASDLAVEGFHEGVVSWLSWRRKVKNDNIRVGPEIEVARYKPLGGNVVQRGK